MEQSTSDTILTEKKAQMQADVDGAGESGYNQKKEKGEVGETEQNANGMKQKRQSVNGKAWARGEKDRNRRRKARDIE